MSSEAPRRGRLIVISGPTASGKSTLWRRLVQRPGVRFSVSATTRPPRPDEVDGRDYHFISQTEFDRRVAAGDFLEWARVHGR
jgi:guanylate kinase